MSNFMLKILNFVNPMRLTDVTQTTPDGVSGGGSYSSGASGYDVTNASELKSMAEVAGSLTLILKKILGPVLIIIGVFAVAFAIYLGVQYAKAEDANKRKEVQGRLVGAIIGAVIIVAAGTLCLAINWSDVYFSFQGTHKFEGTGTYCEYCQHTSGHKFHSAT